MLISLLPLDSFFVFPTSWQYLYPHCNAHFGLAENRVWLSAQPEGPARVRVWGPRGFGVLPTPSYMADLPSLPATSLRVLRPDSTMDHHSSAVEVANELHQHLPRCGHPPWQSVFICGVRQSVILRPAPQRKTRDCQ